MRGILLISERIFTALLHLYPEQFRAANGHQMRLTFRDTCRSAYLHHGTAGLLALWFPTFLDLLKTAFEERTRQGAFTMSKAKLIAWAGPLTVLIGVMWMAASIGELVILIEPTAAETFWDGFWLMPVFLSWIPMLFALIGTRLRYQLAAGFTGNLGMALSTAGCAGMIAFFLVSLLLNVIAPQVEQVVWPDYVMGFCLLCLMLGYILFGVDALRLRLLPRWNLLPLVLGAVALLRFLPHWTGLRNYHPLQLTSFFLHLAITGACWALLGIAMLNQRREGQPEPA